MTKIICGIQARLGSTRLPGKVLMNLGEKRILELVIERCKSSDEIDEVIMAIGDEKENRAIKEFCRRNDINHISGPEDHLLKRHNKLIKLRKPDYYVRITGDCPFVPPEEIDRTIRHHEDNNSDYTTNNTSEMPIGTAVDVFDPEILITLEDQGEEHPVKELRNNPDGWKVSFTDSPRWTQFRDAHTAVDTPEDYWNLTSAVEEVGYNPFKVTEFISEKS